MMFRRIYPPSHAPVAMPPERNPLPLDPTLDPDPGLGHVIPAYGQHLLNANALDAFTAYYQSLQSDDRTILLEGCAKNLDNLQLIEKWAGESPKNHVAQLFAGSIYSHRAWEARGGKLASEVGGGQWNLFSAWLKTAAAYLESAIALDPKDAESYHRMMRVLTGDASLSSKSYLDFFKSAIALRPDHLYAHMEVLTQRCEKWGGSHKLMFDFADETSNRAPEGSLLHVLVPMAILERMVYYMIEKDYDGANSYLRSQAIRDRLAAIYAKTIDSPKLQITPLTPVLYNWLAAALIYSNSHAGRKVLLEKMGDRITERPWAYITMPVIGGVNELRSDFQLPPL